MSRQIKFRVWSKGSKKFIKDDYLAVSLDGGLIWRRIWYSLDEDDSWDDSWTEELHEDQYVIQQFTGLLDKNGHEIYEGDVVKDDSHGIGTVCFGNFSDNEFIQHQGFYIDWKIWPEFDHGFSQRRQLETEVIGNIFENPELLN